MKSFLFIFFIFINALQAQFYINKDVINLYEKPSKKSPISTQLIYSTQIEIIQENKDWVKITSPDLLEEGWIKKNQIIELNELAKENTFAKVKSLWTYLYNEPDITISDPIMALPYDAKVQIVDHVDQRWVAIKTLDGNICYTQKGDFSFEDRFLTINEMTKEAIQFINLPYRWGGASSYGFDCSGFIHVLFKQMGIILPTNALKQSQSDFFEDVTDENYFKKADLLFFTAPNSQQIGHVALYLKNDFFIHSSPSKNLDSKGCIKISSLKDSIYKDYTISVKRLKPEFLSYEIEEDQSFLDMIYSSLSNTWQKTKDSTNNTFEMIKDYLYSTEISEADQS